MSADEDSTLKGEQWKQYNTAFTLYQNNMIAEALVEFQKYLALHPEDTAASWLVENVLGPRLEKKKATVPRSSLKPQKNA
jgi:TolA-binding protein